MTILQTLTDSNESMRGNSKKIRGNPTVVLRQNKRDTVLRSHNEELNVRSTSTYHRG